MVHLLLPAYNEEKSVNVLVPKINKFFKSKKIKYNIIACNDGSIDNTLKNLNKLKLKYPIKIINHKINRGLGETVRDLFEYAAEKSKDDDVIIRMDCDDTHEPEFMEDMINKINEGFDVIIASRFVKGGGQQGVNAYRAFISRVANYFMKFFFPIKNLKEYSSGFRAYKGKAVKHAIRVYGNSFIQLKGLGFTATLEKIVKFKMINAKFGESPMILRYDQKKSDSKMVSSVTTLGYLVLAILYYWPWKGWRRGYKKIEKLR